MLQKCQRNNLEGWQKKLGWIFTDLPNSLKFFASKFFFHTVCNYTLVYYFLYLLYTDQQKVCKILLRHVFKSLKAKKDIDSRPYKQDWAIREALNAEALHKSGSYINLLLLKLDCVVANALGNILNAVDRYCNLHLLHSEISAISSLWLKVFEDTEIVLDLTNGLENTGIDHSNAVFASFKCKFPFFWLLTNNIENHGKNSPINSKY